LRERAVDVWTDPSATLLRIDPHVFNNANDLDRLFDGLDEFLQTYGTTSLHSYTR
jgi:selenocysteine lyase/cysteine desulfurase